MHMDKIEDLRYKKIPTQEDLASLDRDLGFQEVETEDPRELTADQIQTYNREGYIKPVPIFEEKEITKYREHLEGMMEAALDAGQSSYSIISAHLKSPLVYDILGNERIVAHVKDILGEHVVGWGAHCLCKLPGDGKQISWHQDASYWPLTPSRTVTAWLAVDDADIDNACMRFVAGSHRRGHIHYRASDASEQNVLNQTVDDVEQYGEVVYDELKAGEISLHSDLLLHGSDVNRSNRRRFGLTLRYCATEVRAALGWNLEGIVVSGADPSGHWANPPQPTAVEV